MCHVARRYQSVVEFTFQIGVFQFIWRKGSEEIKSYRFTGVIKNNSLENVIELISLTSPISYKIMNSTIRIKKK
nr:DUF4974 domain-containing protein [Phocaeicola vulgatus]